MGLESINFLFITEKCLKESLFNIKNLSACNDYTFVYREEEKFWIDLLLKDSNTLSLRITLCNPLNEVTEAFTLLMKQLFHKKSELYNYESKITIRQIDELSIKVIGLIFQERKKIFNNVYGNITKPIGTDEFYKYLEKS